MWSHLCVVLSLPSVVGFASPVAGLGRGPWAPRAPPRALPSRMQQFDPAMFKQYANPESFEGTDLRITEYPNPVLRAPNVEVREFGEELATLCEHMFTVMYAANGVGIAAPQVGKNLRLFVYNPDPQAPGMLRKMGERVVVNPRVVEYCEATDEQIEGCLSSRSECCVGHVRRVKELSVEYTDVRGRLQKKKLKGFEARVFQHEFDHINGILHIDRQPAADRAKIQPFLDVLVEQHGPGGELEPDLQVLASLPPSPQGGGGGGEAAATQTPRPKKASVTPRSSAEPDEAGAPKASGFGAGLGGSVIGKSSKKGKGGKGSGKGKKRR
jgi:peptide deformylase